MADRVRDLLGEPDVDPGETLELYQPAARSAAGWPIRAVRRLAGQLPVRIDPGRRTALAVGVAVLVAAIVTGSWIAAARPRPLGVAAIVPSLAASATPVGSQPPSRSASTAVGGPGGSGAPGSSAASVPGAETVSVAAVPDVVVDVAGKVHRPGLYHLSPGARIDDAVRAAGGALHGVDLTVLDLAAKVFDGQQIVVGPVAGAQSPAGLGAAGAGAGGSAGTTSAGISAGSGSSSGAAAPISLNSATLVELQTLPGVGPVLAQHIVDYRTAHGSFTSIDELNDVSGIGDVKFAALRDRVTL